MARRRRNVLLNAALGYADKEWHVFPITADAKKPPLVKWKKNATTDKEQIRKWWAKYPNANIGIACGLKSNLYVVDVDVKGSVSGIESIQKIVDENDPINTLQVNTPSGGLHYYFLALSKGNKTRVKRKLGIDVRADGGCVLAPPSMFNGVAYEWSNNGFDSPQVLPDFLLNALSDKRECPGEQYDTCSLLLDGVPKGERNDAVFKYACGLVNKGNKSAEIEILANVMAQNCVPPLPSEEVNKIIASALTYRNSDDAGMDKIIDAYDLINSDIKEPEWIVDGILPKGLTILAGRPKCGKSWLALDIALQVVHGGVILNEYDACKGSVLLLALEDTDYRLKSRIEMLTDETPAAKGLLIHKNFPENGFEKLRESAEGINGLKLIIVDTFAKFRDMAKANSDVVGKDYKEIAKLKSIADDLGIAVLVIHHTRKMKSSDVFQMVSGTSGITGAADNLWVLDRPNDGDYASLHIRGRDTEEQSLILQFDAGHWSLKNAGGVMPTMTEMKILDAFVDGEELSPMEVAVAMNGDKLAISKSLQRMCRRGLITRPKHGVYTLNDAPGV